MTPLFEQVDPDPSSLIQFLSVAIFLILGSAICSGTEAAVFSVSELKIKSLAESGNKKAKSFLKVKEKLSDIIGVIVVLNNLFNIVGSIIIGQIMATIFNDAWIGVLSGVFTFFVILFGEIVPKNAGERFSIPIALWTAKPLLLLRWVFYPIIYLLNLVTHLIFGSRVETFYTSEEEIRMMINEGAKQQTIESDEHKLITNVFSLNDRRARDIMTPRVNIDWVNDSDKLEEIQDEIYKSAHSRVLVYGEDSDDVKGFMLVREALEYLAKGKGASKVESLVNEITKVGENTRADSLLFIFQKKKAHIAVVRDEFGGTAGIVTLEDVLEEIVGEIVDETDEVADMREV